MTTTQVEFFQNNAIDGALTPEQAARLMEMPEGDTSITLETDGQPEAITDQANTEVAGKAVEEAKPVILAKDGVHTIEYEKLVEAREAEKHWKQVALDAQAQLEAQKAAPAAPPAETPAADDADLFGDFSEEGITNGVKKIVANTTAALQAEFDAKLNAVLAPLQAKQAESAETAHFAAIEAVHPDVESIAQSESFAKWIDNQPSFVRDGYKAVITQGTAEQVIEALNTYKAATGKLTPPAKSGVEDAAQAVISKARTAVPASLTDFAGGTAGPGSKFEAMDSMSPAQMSEAMQSMTPEQIEKYLNRNF